RTLHDDRVLGRLRVPGISPLRRVPSGYGPVQPVDAAAEPGQAVDRPGRCRRADRGSRPRTGDDLIVAARPLHVAVVGYGTAGQTAAILLARDGHRVEVFEQSAALGPVGAGVLLQPVGLQVLWE